MSALVLVTVGMIGCLIWRGWGTFDTSRMSDSYLGQPTALVEYARLRSGPRSLPTKEAFLPKEELSR